MNRLTVLAVLPFIASCSLINGDKSLCEKSVRDTLINPETAEFMEFDRLEKEVAVNKFSQAMLKAADVSDPPEGMMPYVKGMAEQNMKDVKNTYLMRVKADGRLGNTITSHQVCLVKKDNCECYDLPS